MLPKNIIKLIFQYDNTFHEIFKTVLHELVSRYNDGKWWIKCTHIIHNSNKYYKKISFTTRDEDFMVFCQDCLFDDLLVELKDAFYQMALIS